MKRLFQLVFLLMICLSLSVTKGQIIESFDSDLSADPTYDLNVEGSPSRIDYTINTTDFMEGTGAGHVNFVFGAFHEWGTYAQLIKRVPDGEPLLDWSTSDSLSIWIKVLQAPTVPGNMVFRIQIADRPSDTDPIEEYIYENATVLDEVGDWYELKIPLFEREQPGTEIPNDEGFILAPTSWGGFSYNNLKLDYDKIVGYNISAVTSGYTSGVNLPADSVVVMFDEFKKFGVKAVPAVIFNGITFPSNITTWAWGQSTIDVEPGAGPVPNSNAIKWVQGNEWANGWTGIGTTNDPTFNLAGAWLKDTVQFKMKAEAGVGELRFQLEGGGGKRGWNFTPTDDNQWHTYKVALQDLIYPPGEDPTKYGPIDSSAINSFGMMAEATGVAGKVIYITDWWTGNPEFDVIPPDAPQNIFAFSGDFQNVITWEDVPGETGEKYDVYYSANPITDANLSGAEVVALNIKETDQLATHLLFAPVTDQSVTFYYAVVCKDASGNKSVVSVNSSAVTNTAKGVTTISLNPPTFVADGDLSEWQSITPFRMFVSDGTGHIVANQQIDNDADCSALSWVAVDQEYLYVAFDVFDDIFVPDAQSTSYLNDAPDIYLGLYNWHGTPHTSLKRGGTPDYHFRFAYNRVLIDNISSADSIVGLGDDYYFGEAIGSGYRVEFRIKWADLAAIGGDSLFTPVEGMRIPIDYSINDADATNEREGILTYSLNNEDLSYGDVSRWTYTWIGSLWNPVGVENEAGQTVNEYTLSQNYPNPFNPSTQIQFSVKNTGLVSLKIFDVLGREVATLVNKELSTGNYTVNFNAAGLASGIYFYRLESGSFIKTNKMMLLK